MASVAEAFAVALQHHQAGNLAQAEQIYGLILRADPGFADAHHLLGVCSSQLGRHEQAVASIRHAVALNPAVAAYHSNLGLAQQSLGRLDDAVASYRRAIRLQPDFAEARCNLAGALLGQGKLEEAEEHGRHALLLQPLSAPAHNNLGYALLRRHKLDEAVAHFQEALRIQPNFADAHNNLGLAHAEQDRLDEAVAACTRALELNPHLAAAHNNLGHALGKMGKYAEAVASYREAVRIKPDFAEAFHNLGSGLAQLKYLNEAETNCRQALKIRPNYEDALATLGAILWEQGNTTEALATLQQALSLHPTDLLRRLWATRLPVIYDSAADVAFWRERLIKEISQLHERRITFDLTHETAVPLFYLAFQGMNDRDIQRQIARLYRAPPAFADCPPTGSGAGGGKIHVGFLSSMFRKHTLGHLMRGLIAKLSRQRFLVTVLSVGKYHDEIADFIREHADRYVEIPRQLPSARRLIAEQKLDVLFYADIGMDEMSSSLAFSRLAPVQCVTWGHPTTTGIDTLDYFISAEDLETEDSDEHYTEKLIRLKTLPIFYYRPQLPAPLKDREHFGLSKEDHVYACPQSMFKLHPDFDEILAGILRGDPRGKLVLMELKDYAWDQQLRRRLAAVLPDGMDRVRFLPLLDRSHFINLMAVADVLLDPLHYGGGNTTYEGLAVGTPVVTLPSRFLRGRISYTLYRQMQVMDCVVDSPEEFIQLSLRLGTDADFRQAMRGKILGACDVLFENMAGVRELEQFFIRAVLASRGMSESSQRGL